MRPGEADIRHITLCISIGPRFLVLDLDQHLRRADVWILNEILGVEHRRDGRARVSERVENLVAGTALRSIADVGVQ
jgi:hypothetical protein